MIKEYIKRVIPSKEKIGAVASYVKGMMPSKEQVSGFLPVLVMGGVALGGVYFLMKAAEGLFSDKNKNKSPHPSPPSTPPATRTPKNFTIYSIEPDIPNGGYTKSSGKWGPFPWQAIDKVEYVYTICAKFPEPQKVQVQVWYGLLHPYGQWDNVSPPGCLGPTPGHYPPDVPGDDECALIKYFDFFQNITLIPGNSPGTYYFKRKDWISAKMDNHIWFGLRGYPVVTVVWKDAEGGIQKVTGINYKHRADLW